MIRILCFGNPLHGDDGLGAAVFARLSALPRGRVELIEAGTPGLSALALFEGCARILVVDALAPRGAPGRISVLAPERVCDERAPAPHGAGLGWLLKALAALPGARPKIRIIGAQAESHRPFQPGLSPAMDRAAEKIARRLSPFFEKDHVRA